jgi:maltose-binding protein MalE
VKIFKRRHLISLIMTAVLILSLSGCGLGSDKNAKKLDIDTEVTVNVWYNDENYTDYLNYIAERFHDANEFVTVQPVYTEQNHIVDAVYDENIHGDGVVDVYLMDSSDLEQAYLSGMLAENDIYTDNYTEEYYPVEAVNAACYGGKLYGYPVTFNTAVMVYNKKYVSSVSTFEEITSFIKNYQVNADNQNVTTLITWDTASMMINYAFGGSYMTVGGAAAESADIIDIQTESFRTALEDFAELRNAYGISKSGISQEECLKRFTNGQLLYTIIESKNLSVLNASDVDYGICKIPAVKQGYATKSLSDTTIAVVSPYSKNQETAKALAYAISFDYAEVFEEYTGLVSARQDLKSVHEEGYKALYEVYGESDIHAKYMGAEGFYLRYEILLHNLWSGENADEAFNQFYQNIKK